MLQKLEFSTCRAYIRLRL